MSSNSRSLSQERFGRFAEGYVNSQSHAKGADLQRLLDIARPESNWNVLDIATGGGHTALKFAPQVDRVLAADITPRMLDAAREFITGLGITNVQFLATDAENLPLVEEHFDLVTCRIAPHHFPDCARFVRDAARTLKSGGLLILQDHVLPEDASAARYVDSFERLRDPSHNRAFNRSQWIGMFEAAGLEVEHTEEIIKRHPLIPWAERQGCTADTNDQLKQLLVKAPTIAAEWLQAYHIGTPEATFVNHHIIISGRKDVLD